MKTGGGSIDNCTLTNEVVSKCKLQEALLWQRDRATRLSVEILQLRKILFENYSPGPIVWHYLRDPIRLAVFTQYLSVTDTHTQTDRWTDRYSIASRGKNRPYCTAHQV